MHFTHMTLRARKRKKTSLFQTCRDNRLFTAWRKLYHLDESRDMNFNGAIFLWSNVDGKQWGSRNGTKKKANYDNSIITAQLWTHGRPLAAVPLCCTAANPSHKTNNTHLSLGESNKMRISLYTSRFLQSFSLQKTTCSKSLCRYRKERISETYRKKLPINYNYDCELWGT